MRRQTFSTTIALSVGAVSPILASALKISMNLPGLARTLHFSAEKYAARSRAYPSVTPGFGIAVSVCTWVGSLIQKTRSMRSEGIPPCFRTRTSDILSAN